MNQYIEALRHVALYLLVFVFCYQENISNVSPPVLQVMTSPGDKFSATQYNNTSEELAVDTGQFVSLVASGEGHVINGTAIQDSVLEEFSTVVADTQEYIVGREGNSGRSEGQQT